MRYNEPDDKTIERLRAQFSDRSLHLVEAVEGDEVYCFVMTGPSRDEYKKFLADTSASQEAKDEATRFEKLRGAVEQAALAQIRYPDRDEVRRVFDHKPAFSLFFAEELHKAAGSTVEVRSKKL